MARPSRKTEIKERVLAAALELTAEGGFQQSPMSKLAQVAGVSVGTIYLYFPSKDELIAALFEDIRQKMQESILHGYDQTKDIHTRFDTLFMNLSRYYLDHKRDFVFIVQLGFSSF
jgi:AcrR family transcriptional regulator